MNKLAIARRIASKRIEKGFSPKQVADEFNVNVSTYYKIEDGGTNWI